MQKFRFQTIAIGLLLLISVSKLATAVSSNSTPLRIAVAGGSITEIIYAFEEQHRIVAVDTTSVFPADAIENKEKIGYVRAISNEGILSLEPDLLFGEHDTGPQKVMDQLKSTNLNIEILPQESGLESVDSKITKVAHVLGVEQKGTELNTMLDYDRKALAFAKENIKEKPKVLFLLSLRGGTPTAAGSSTSADIVIKAAGGENVLKAESGWIKLNVESALKLNPDAIIIMGRDKSVSRIDDAKDMPHFKFSNAVKNDAVHEIAGSYLLNFGPRAYQAVIELGTLIHSNFPLPEAYEFRFPQYAETDVKLKSAH